MHLDDSNQFAPFRALLFFSSLLLFKFKLLLRLIVLILLLLLPGHLRAGEKLC